MVIVICTLIDNEYASYVFSQTIFTYCFCMLSEFANVFERKIWRVQVAHLHNEARALSSPSRLSTNLGKDFFRYLKQFECSLTWHYWWLGSTDLGLINRHVFEQSECRNCCLYIIIQKIAPQTESGKFFQIWFFPIWGKNGGVLSMRMQVILDSPFARPGSAPIGGGKKGEFRDWTTPLQESAIYASTVRTS